MTPSQAMTRYCDANTRSGGKCRRPGGWGTDHVGAGRCKLHGGSTRNHRRAARRAEALDFAVGALGAEVASDPFEALLQSVRIASGQVVYWRVRLLPYQGEGEHAEEETPRALIEGLDSALDRQAKCAKAALDAGVAEKLVEISGRMAERLTLAFEEAAQAMKLDAATRAVGVEVFAAALTRMEGEPIDVEARQLAGRPERRATAQESGRPACG
jgi:hypothetical protein